MHSPQTAVGELYQVWDLQENRSNHFWETKLKLWLHTVIQNHLQKCLHCFLWRMEGLCQKKINLSLLTQVNKDQSYLPQILSDSSMLQRSRINCPTQLRNTNTCYKSTQSQEFKGPISALVLLMQFSWGGVNCVAGDKCRESTLMNRICFLTLCPQYPF